MRTLFASIALALAVSAGSAGAQIVTKMSGIQPLEHPSSYAEKFFAEQVATLTNGTVKVETYHNTQLGDAVANVQSVRNGTIGFTVVSASNLNQVVPAMDMLSLPFIFKNEAHFWWYLAQPQAENFVKALEEKGIKKVALPRLGFAQPFHPEGGQDTGRLEGPEDPRHGVAGDGQDDGIAGRDRRAGGLGRALHRAADGRGRRRREQPPVGRGEEILRSVEVLHHRQHMRIPIC
jgi:hypothetical protein